jgi:hypothetical protein
VLARFVVMLAGEYGVAHAKLAKLTTAADAIESAGIEEREETLFVREHALHAST